MANAIYLVDIRLAGIKKRLEVLACSPGHARHITFNTYPDAIIDSISKRVAF